MDKCQADLLQFNARLAAAAIATLGEQIDDPTFAAMGAALTEQPPEALAPYAEALAQAALAAQKGQPPEDAE
jgi:hypothetical protein